MYLSLRTEGVQKYLQIDIQADPDKVKKEIPKLHRKALTNFALWLFGNEERSPLFTDSRQVDNFGRILQSKDASRIWKEKTQIFEVALRMAGGDEPEIVKLVEKAADNIELALTRAHHYKKSSKLATAVSRLLSDTHAISKLFPGVERRVSKEEE